VSERRMDKKSILDFENSSIPILKSDKVITDQWYMLRLTPDSMYSSGEVEQLMKVFAEGEYVMSFEESKSGKAHFHCVFTCYKDPRDDIKEWLQTYWRGKWKKEDGNKRYNLTLVEDIKTAMTYIVKDGFSTVGSSINPDYYEHCKKKSFKKYSKEAFTIEFEKLKADYKEDIITSKELRTKIIQLKGLYRQPVNLMRITEIVLSCMVNKDPTLAEDL
jgi:hypothetical protein